MISLPLSGASPPRKVAEYDSVPAYRAGQGVPIPATLSTQFQLGDKLIVLEANGKQWTELWRDGQRVGAF